MTHGFLLLFAFVRTISYQNWFVYVELYYLQLFTIIPYHLSAHIMLLRYVICNYIWHMGSQNYDLLSQRWLGCIISLTFHAYWFFSIFKSAGIFCMIRVFEFIQFDILTRLMNELIICLNGRNDKKIYNITLTKAN